ncbi:family 16 glycoside hydrolase [Candidatus Nitrosocosmicus sp. T]
MAAILMLVPILGIPTDNTTYSSTSSSMYDNIQKKFDNLLPFKVPQLDKEEKTDSQSNDDTEDQSTEKKFDNLLPFKISPLGEKIPLELPPLDEDFPFEVPQLDKEEKTDSQSAQMAATADTSCTASLIDKFHYPQYLLREGHTSPNGEWKNVYSGYGSTGVHEASQRVNFWLNPQASTSASETHAALVMSNDIFCNFSMQTDINTAKQLRQNSPANTWEVGWLFFRYSDTFHYYWLLVKPNGIELGKKDCDTCTNPVDGQKFLVTKSSPTLKINTWNNVKIDMIGNNIKVYWNGNLVIDYIDTTMSPKLASGAIAMYSEDAYVKYDNMNVSPK